MRSFYTLQNNFKKSLSYEYGFKGFYVDFPYLESQYSPIKEGINYDPLLGSSPDDPSGTLYFLSNIYQDGDRAERLITFRQMLYDIVMNHQYVFTEISGINDCVNMKQDAKLEVKMYDDAKMNIHTMAQLYDTIIYDRYFKRYVLPENLKWFFFRLYIFDIRNFTLSNVIIDKRKQFEQEIKKYFLSFNKDERSFITDVNTDVAYDNKILRKVVNDLSGLVYDYFNDSLTDEIMKKMPYYQIDFYFNTMSFELSVPNNITTKVGDTPNDIVMIIRPKNVYIKTSYFGTIIDTSAPIIDRITSLDGLIKFFKLV